MIYSCALNASCKGETMKHQPLDKIERQVLANQYAILAKLDPDSAIEYAR